MKHGLVTLFHHTDLKDTDPFEIKGGSDLQNINLKDRTTARDVNLRQKCAKWSRQGHSHLSHGLLFEAKLLQTNRATIPPPRRLCFFAFFGLSVSRIIQNVCRRILTRSLVGGGVCD